MPAAEMPARGQHAKLAGIVFGLKFAMRESCGWPAAYRKRMRSEVASIVIVLEYSRGGHVECSRSVLSMVL